MRELSARASEPDGVPEAEPSWSGPRLVSLSLPTEERLPCRTHDSDLWFAEGPGELEIAKQLCRTCPVRSACLVGALSRHEPWGVWGGEIFEDGAVIARKRGRGRPSRRDLLAWSEIKTTPLDATA